MLAEQRIHRRAAALERHEGEIDLGHALEHFEADMLRGRRPVDRHRHLARLGAGRVDQFGERAVRRRGVHSDDIRRAREMADRLETSQRVVVELLHIGIDDEGIAHDQHRVAVRRGARHRFGGDHRAGAGPVLDHHRGPCCWLMWFATSRASISVPPAGANGTTMRIVRVCDQAPSGAASGAAASRNQAGGAIARRLPSAPPDRLGRKLDELGGIAAEDGDALLIGEAGRVEHMVDRALTQGTA